MTLPSGNYTLSVNGGKAEQLLSSDNTVDAAQKTLGIEVQPNAMVEDRDVNADPQTMASIAHSGSGIAMDGAYFDVLASHLPVVDRTENADRSSRIIQRPERCPNTNRHWAFFAVFIILLTAEWILRKRGGLV